MCPDSGPPEMRQIYLLNRTVVGGGQSKFISVINHINVGKSPPV